MKVGIVGLGLIGGSFAKAIKKRTDHIVCGADINTEVLSRAKAEKAVDFELNDGNLAKCDILLIALYPAAITDYLKEKAELFNKNGYVIDLCGVKRQICAVGESLAQKHGFKFIGGHPMAGREVFGYDAAIETLFDGASMILVPSGFSKGAAEMTVPDEIKEFFLSVGFSHIQISTASYHDEVIACTSQLAHVVSSAYVKTPQAPDFYGFSAGSFKDMTRVAYMNENVWTELFLNNADMLKAEIDSLVKELNKYSDALERHDAEEIKRLIREGTRLKIELNEKEELRKSGRL
ncbi:MAG: prephenate dehydrogenase [Acutalibacteraceae bacterium]